MTTPKAIIVDDESQLRKYLKSQLAIAWPKLEICGEAKNGREAIEQIETCEPDIVFLDINMPGLSGIEVAKKFLINAGSYLSPPMTSTLSKPLKMKLSIIC